MTDGYSACQAPPALSPISKDSGVSCLLGTTRGSAGSLKLHRPADVDSEKQPQPRAPTGSREAAQQMPRHNGDLEGHNLPLSSPFIPTPVIHLIWAKHKPQCFQPPPATRRHTRWRQPGAQRRSPLHGKLPQPKNRLALTKAAVILLSARFPRNCSEKGASAEPGNPSSWGKTTTFLQKGYSSVHLDCAGSYLNPELIIFNLLISYLLLFHFFTLNK